MQGEYQSHQVCLSVRSGLVEDPTQMRSHSRKRDRQLLGDRHAAAKRSERLPRPAHPRKHVALVEVTARDETAILGVQRIRGGKRQPLREAQAVVGEGVGMVSGGEAGVRDVLPGGGERAPQAG